MLPKNACPSTIIRHLEGLISNGTYPTPTQWSLLILAHGKSKSIKDADNVYKIATSHYKYHPKRLSMRVDRLYGSMMSVSENSAQVSSVFNDLINHGYTPDSTKGHLLIRSHIRNDDFPSALASYDRLKALNIPLFQKTYHALIKSAPDAKRADLFFAEMLQERVKPSVSTFIHLLMHHQESRQRRIPASDAALKPVRKIFDDFKFMKLVPNLDFYTLLIGIHLHHKDTSTAMFFVGEIKAADLKPDIKLYNTILQSFTNLNFDDGSAIGIIDSCMKSIFEAQVQPDSQTLLNVVSVFMRAGDVGSAFMWIDALTQAPHRKRESKICLEYRKCFAPVAIDSFVHNAIIHGLGRNGRDAQALEYFSSLREPNVHALTSLIHWAFQNTTDFTKAQDLFYDNFEHFEYDLGIYNAMLAGYARLDQSRMFFGLLKSMPYDPSATTFRIVVKALLRSTRNNLEFVTRVYDSMVASGVKIEESVYVGILTKFGHRNTVWRHDAERVLGSSGSKIDKKRDESSVISEFVDRVWADYQRGHGEGPPMSVWDAISAFYIHRHREQDAVNLIGKMTSCDIIPDQRLLLRMIKWYGSFRTPDWSHNRLDNWSHSLGAFTNIWRLYIRPKSTNLRHFFIAAFVASYGKNKMKSDWGCMGMKQIEFGWVNNLIRTQENLRGFHISKDLYNEAGLLRYWKGINNLDIYDARGDCTGSIGENARVFLNEALGSLKEGVSGRDCECRSHFYSPDHVHFTYLIVRHCENQGFWNAREAIMADFCDGEDWSVSRFDHHRYNVFE